MEMVRGSDNILLNNVSGVTLAAMLTVLHGCPLP
jgi:hypothetical protein